MKTTETGSHLDDERHEHTMFGYMDKGKRARAGSQCGVRGTMKLRLLAGAALAALALSAATPALASTPPTKVQAQVTGWTGMSVKPGDIYFGQGGVPFITSLHWLYWHNGASAYATGTLHQLADPNCHPVYQCKYASEPSTVYLYTVKVHGTLHYFYNMAVRFKHNGAWHRQVGVFKPFPGGTDPSWIFPAVWPYL